MGDRKIIAGWELLFMKKKGEKIIEILKPLLGVGLLMFGIPMALAGGEWSKLYIIISLPFFIFGVLHIFNLLSKEEEGTKGLSHFAEIEKKEKLGKLWEEDKIGWKEMFRRLRKK